MRYPLRFPNHPEFWVNTQNRNRSDLKLVETYNVVSGGPGLNNYASTFGIYQNGARVLFGGTNSDDYNKSVYIYNMTSPYLMSGGLTSGIGKNLSSLIYSDRFSNDGFKFLASQNSPTNHFFYYDVLTAFTPSTIDTDNYDILTTFEKSQRYDWYKDLIISTDLALTPDKLRIWKFTTEWDPTGAKTKTFDAQVDSITDIRALSIDKDFQTNGYFYLIDGSGVIYRYIFDPGYTSVTLNKILTLDVQFSGFAHVAENAGNYFYISSTDGNIYVYAWS